MPGTPEDRTPPEGGTPLPGSPYTAEAARRRLRFAWAVVLGVTVVALVGAAVVLRATGVTGGGWATLAMAGVIALGAAGAAASSAQDRRRRREQLAVAFAGSLDAARASLDHDALRALRDAEGELVAVRAVRRQLPMLELQQAVDIVRSL